MLSLPLPPLHSPWTPVLACAAVATAHLAAERWFRGAFAHSAAFQRLSHVLALGYAAVSFCHVVWGVRVLLPHLIADVRAGSLWCGRLPSSSSPPDAGGESRDDANASSDAIDRVLLFYFACKLWEGVDLLTVTLRGYPVVAHFRWHHYSTPLFAYLGWASRSHHGALFLLLNTFMHSMVYVFHSSPTFRLPWLHRAIRAHQYVQLGVGVAAAMLASVGAGRGGPGASASGAPWPSSLCSAPPAGSLVAWTAPFVDAVPAALFTLYFVLFQLELRGETAAAAAAEAQRRRRD